MARRLGLVDAGQGRQRAAPGDLRFGPDDEEAFAAARDGLLEGLERWVTDGDDGPSALVDLAASDELVAAAGTALDWKWGYGDGDLCTWRLGDVAEYLLEWCPRKLSVPPEDWATFPAGFGALAGFLTTVGLLGPASAPLPKLLDALRQLLPEYLEAMGDPSRWGMAKSLFAGAAGEGVDLTDRAQLEGWMADFNSRPQEDRDAMLGPALMPPTRPAPVALPPVAVPPADELAASRADAPVLVSFARLADFVGDGCKLTQTGNLTLADGRQLVEILGTGDRFDPVIGDRTFKTRSSGDLPVLRHIFLWARKAGILRVAHGKVVATRLGRGLATEPEAGFDRAADGLLAAGAVSSQRVPNHWFSWPEVDALLDGLVPHILGVPYAAQQPVALSGLAEVAAREVLDAFRFPRTSDEDVARRVTIDVTDMADALERAGLLRRSGFELPTDDWSRRRKGGEVEITPAGVEVARRWLVKEGMAAPIARFTDASAAELLLGTDAEDFPVLRGELSSWQRRRSPESAAAGLAEAARTLEDPALRNLALAALGEVDLEAAEPEVRRLAAEPACRGFARCWLVDHADDPASSLLDPSDSDAFVDVLAQRLVTGGPEALAATLALAGSHDTQVSLLRELWRSPNPATGSVLDALGATHPVRIVAKAARKALFQRRSAGS